MIKAILSDFSRVVLFPKDDSYEGSLNKMHEQKSTESDYNFWNYYRINEELVNSYKSLKNKYKIYCFTTGRIQEYPELNNKIKEAFERIFTVDDIKIQKTDPNSYSYIVEQIRLQPDEVIFIDDTLENVEAAQKAKLKTILYKNNTDLMNVINNIK